VDALRNFSALNYLAIKQLLAHYERAVHHGAKALSGQVCESDIGEEFVCLFLLSVVCFECAFLVSGG
jgi:hypothetical protein